MFLVRALIRAGGHGGWLSRSYPRRRGLVARRPAPPGVDMRRRAAAVT